MCLGHPNWTICKNIRQFWSQNFTPFSLLYWRPILITLESEWLKKGKWISPNLSLAPVFQCLGHSNWTICSRLSQCCSTNFPLFPLLYWEANSYYPREGQAENGKMEISQSECDIGFSVPGAIKLDHLQQINPTLLQKFSKISPLYWEANSYYPREGQAGNGKMEISQPENDTSFSVPGAFKLDHLQPSKPILFPKFYNFFIFMLGGQFLLPQGEEGWKWENGFHPT